MEPVLPFVLLSLGILMFHILSCGALGERALPFREIRAHPWLAYAFLFSAGGRG